VLRPGPAVVALGSGAVLDAGTREALGELRASGTVVVLLDVRPEEAARRAGLNHPRPLLLGNPRAQLRALLDARRPWYLEIATQVVDTDGLTAQDLAAALADALASTPASAPAQVAPPGGPAPAAAADEGDR
jgi:shikimate kinase